MTCTGVGSGHAGAGVPSRSHWAPDRLPLAHPGPPARDHLRRGSVGLPLRAVCAVRSARPGPFPRARDSRVAPTAARRARARGPGCVARAPSSVPRRVPRATSLPSVTARARAARVTAYAPSSACRRTAPKSCPKPRSIAARSDGSSGAPSRRRSGASPPRPTDGLGRALGRRPREDGHGGHPAAVSRRLLARRGSSGAGRAAAAVPLGGIVPSTVFFRMPGASSSMTVTGTPASVASRVILVSVASR